MLPLALAPVALWHFGELTWTRRSAEITSRSLLPRRSRWYVLLFLVLLLGTGLTLAAGWHTPFSGLIYRVPVLGRLRAVERGLVLASLSLSLLGGFGLQRIVEQPRRQAWLLLPASLVLIVPVLFVWAGQAHPSRLQALFGINPHDLEKLSLAWPGAYVPLLLALASALLLTWWSWRPGGTLTQGVAAALMLIDLGVYAVGFNATTDRGFYEYQPPVMRVLQGHDELFRKATLLVDINGALDRVGQDTLALSWGMVHSIEDINGFNSLQPRRYTDYVFGPRVRDVSYGYFPDQSLLRSDSAILNSLNVRYLIVPATVLIHPGPHLRPVFEDMHVRVFENMQAYPRAYFAERVWSELDPQAVLRQVTAAGFDGRHNALVEATDAPSVQPSTTPARAEATRTSPTELRVTTNTAERRFLVVSEMYFPGWRAYVDGVQTPIFRTNYLFRGVVVPAGQHVVSFVYRPSSALVGAAVSALALIGTGVLLHRGFRTPHRQTLGSLAMR
jgi:hypothetical protein